MNDVTDDFFRHGRTMAMDNHRIGNSVTYLEVRNYQS